MDEEMFNVSAVFPNIAIQLRSALANMHLAAAQLAPAAEREREHARLFALRERFARQVLAGTDALRNGDAKHSLPGVVSFTFDGTDGEAVLYALDLAGVAASGGAACSSGAPEPSHVLLAMGRSEAQARASVRFSFGRENTEEDADFAAETVIQTIQKLRARRAEE